MTMSKMSVLLLAFLLTVVNGLYIPKEGNEDDEKRSVFGVDCTTNSECQSKFAAIGSWCLIMPSSGLGKCVMRDESTEKRSLSKHTHFKCERDFDCIGFGFYATCQGGYCSNQQMPGFP